MADQIISMHGCVRCIRAKNHKKPMKEATPDDNSVVKNARNGSNFKVMGNLHQSLTFRRVFELEAPRRERRWLLVVDAKTL